MISMVNFEFGIAGGPLAAKKDGTKEGGFEELLARTAAQLSGDASASAKTAANEAKDKETEDSAKSAGGETIGSGDDEVPKGNTAEVSTVPQALAAVLLSAPLPPRTQEEFAQDLTAGTKENVQRAAEPETEKQALHLQAAIGLKTPPKALDFDAAQVSDAEGTSEIPADFEAALSDVKMAQPQTLAKAAELSPQDAAGAGQPQTYAAKEAAIRVTGMRRSDQTDDMAKTGETLSKSTAMEMDRPVTGAKKPNTNALPNENTFGRAAADIESALKKTSWSSTAAQSAKRGSETAEKPQDKPHDANTVEPMKFAAPAGVERTVPEAKTAEIRQPVYEQVAKEVTKSAENMPADGSCIFDMKLFPEGLGKLEVRMTCEGKNLTLTVTAHSEEAAKLLTGGAEKLKSTLSENYQVTQLEIRTELRTDTQSGTTFFANGFGGSGHYGSAYGKEQSGHIENERDIGTEAALERRIQVGILDARV